MKRLVFCFDGSWNRLDALHPTNVVITAESVLPSAGGVSQIVHYDEGVGTGKWDRLRGGMFGRGLLQNIGDAYRFLIFNYTEGDEIYIFGFSRGAYTARSFAGLISNASILRKRDAAMVNKAVELYRTREKSADYERKCLEFRAAYSPGLCINEEEDAWRLVNVSGYGTRRSHLIMIKYIGVWDTVGALGIPSRYTLLNPINRRHQFHDTSLSHFVEGARHAVAIDEKRKDFQPTLWDNVAELNGMASSDPEARDAAYQQQWFPGTHGSVGGGGERRGLSDQALDWVLDGARNQGLKLDTSQSSRIYELRPDYREFLNNTASSGLLYRTMNRFSAADRSPGPKALFEVSVSARRRWLEDPTKLKDRVPYRPSTLARVSKDIDRLDPASLGVGLPEPQPGTFALYDVREGDTLSAIARRVYGRASEWRRIAEANADKLENPDKIYVGERLRIPKIDVQHDLAPGEQG